ncbi:MAG TPA: matrixin family metalloprotease, partial [Cellulomonas sp.]|nr:matrixin family metalloprotease [Cellulomonas sp.]
PQPGAPPVRRGTWLRLVSMLVAVALVIGGMQWFAHLRNVALLGPDGSGVVVSMSADELPAPEVLHREVPAPGFEEADDPLGTPPSAPASSEYAFIDTQRDDSGNLVPVAWSPCRPIHVVVDETGAPEGFLDEVVAALGATSVATGLVFVTDGVTTEPASEERRAFLPTLYGDRWAPVLVRFADASEVSAMKGDVVGLSSTQSYEDTRTGLVYYVSGTVYLDSALLHMRGIGGVPAYVQVLRHELGHMVGLDHVDEFDQLMYPNANRVVTFQDGDLAGLAQLGAGACAPGL